MDCILTECSIGRVQCEQVSPVSSRYARYLYHLPPLPFNLVVAVAAEGKPPSWLRYYFRSALAPWSTPYSSLALLIAPHSLASLACSETDRQDHVQEPHVRRNRDFPYIIRTQEGIIYQTRFLPSFILLLPLPVSPRPPSARAAVPFPLFLENGDKDRKDADV